MMVCLVLAVVGVLLETSAVSSVLLPGKRLTPYQLREEQLLAASAPSVFSNDWAVQVGGGAQAADILASSTGFINMGQIGNLEGFYHFQLNMTLHRNRSKHLTSHSIGSLSQMRESPDFNMALKEHSNVGFVEQQRLFKRVPKDYMLSADPIWNREWSLLNTGDITNGPSGYDLNVEPAWMQDITGTDVVVAIVDNGLEKSHADLAKNFDSGASYDFVDSDDDPTPDNYYGDEPDDHGTMCAGVVGMVKNNHHCGVGVAYDAKVGGIKFSMSSGTDLMEAKMLGYQTNHIHIYSNSWGPNDYGFTVAGPESLARQALEIAVKKGRNEKGSIYIWAAGNGGIYHDSCSADGYSSSMHTISVGSADYNGHQADYDENCPSKMAVTFSYNSQTFPDDPNSKPYNQLSTTTLRGKCTDGFTGTSASTPLLSGTMALVLQANPLLTWRDVQYLVAYTSTQDKLVDGQWVTNGADLKVSHKFGFGAIDAEAMVTRARRWTNVPPQYSAVVTAVDSVNWESSTWYAYPHNDYSDNDIYLTFNVSSAEANGITSLEHVVASMSLTLNDYGHGYDENDFYSEYENYPEDIYQWLAESHPKRGDIQVTLTSPHNTTSTLLPYRLYDYINEEGYDHWPFMSVLHWGENPVGTWTLRVSYRSSSGYVTLSDLEMRIYGTLETPASVSQIPSQCDPACRGRCSGPGSQNCDICKEMRVASTLECVEFCPNDTVAFKNYCLEVLPTLPPTSNLPSILGGSIGGVLLLLVIFVIIIFVAVRVYRRPKGVRFTQLQSMTEPERV